MMEFTKAVESVLGGERREVAAPVGSSSPPGSSDPKIIPLADTVVDERLPLPPVAKPAPKKRYGPPVTLREKLGELAGGFSLAPLVTAAFTAPCALVPTPTPWLVLTRIFLLSTLLTWALILVSRLPRRDHKSPWSRRAVQLVVGFGIGAMAFWLDGWAIPTGNASATSQDLVIASGHRFSPELFQVGFQYLACFGLATAACRWWVATDRKRKVRVRLIPVLAVTFWATLFCLLLWPREAIPFNADREGWLPPILYTGVPVLVIAAIAVQAASPWAGPPIPVAYPARPRPRPMYGY
jgi:eukaryotic-like serine/threonine-protein kinase